MAKQIEKMSVAKREEQVAKLLAKRAERLQTKKFPRPTMFAEEMASSEELYRYRVEVNASENFVKKVIKAAGLATSETTDYSNGRLAGQQRTGAWINGVGMGTDFGAERDNVCVTVKLCEVEDEQAYVEALAVVGLVATIGYARKNDALNCVTGWWGTKWVQVIC